MAYNANGRHGAENPKTAAKETALLKAHNSTHINRNSVLVKVNGRTVAEVRPDGVLQKHIRFSVHLYRKLNAVAFDVSALDQAERAGAKWVEIYDDESGRVYHTRLATFRANATSLNFAGAQLALPLKYWQRGTVGNPGPDQLALWEVA